MADGLAAPSSEAPAVEAVGISKRFGALQAVEGIDLRLGRTGVCGLLGPNGAGKTTTIRMIAGVFPPDAGVLRVAGRDAQRESAGVRAVVGYLPESAPLFPELTPREYMRFRAGLAGIPRSRSAVEIESALDRCDALRFAHRCCGTLSKGMQQRVGLAAAILGDPRVVILDEPSVGLDPEQTIAFRRLVRRLGEDRLVLFSSHLLAEVEAVCTELAVIASGRLLAHDPIGTFRARAAARRVVVESDQPLEGLADSSAVEGGCGSAVLEESRLTDGWWRSTHECADPGVGAERIGRIAREAGVVLRRLEPESPSLESVFVSLVGQAAGREGGR
jgi:ABC-2 type transport system ATP-binding protein